MITQETVRRLFDYREGKLIRRIPMGKAKAGVVAGWPDREGYMRVRVEGQAPTVHRVVWLWHYGYLPENQIDHINKVRADNRIENLREASQMCNMRNRKQQESTSGVKGISWDKDIKQWRAQIKIAGAHYHIGNSHCLLEAACLRLAAEQAVDWPGCEEYSPAFAYVKNNINKTSLLGSGARSKEPAGAIGHPQITPGGEDAPESSQSTRVSG
jgi:hypothetical protein